MSRKNSTYTIGMKLRFGKYDGQLVEDVIKHDRSYIKWCINNIEWFRLGEKASNLFLKTRPKRTKRSRHNRREPHTASQQGHLECFGHTGPNGGWGNIF